MNSALPVVHILDDDASSVWLIQRLLEGIGVECIGYTAARDFFDRYSPRPSECLICDLRMPEIGGLDVQQRLVAAEAALPTIFVSGYPEFSAAVAAFKAGAFDFLSKPIDGQALLTKVQEALRLSRTLHDKRLQSATRDARLALLSLKEREVADHVVRGKSSKEIAELLQLSARTVENHRASIMRKIRADSLADLIKALL